MITYLSRTARTLAVAAAGAGLTLGALVAAPSASASMTPGPAGCGVTYKHSKGITTQTVRMTNNCSWGTHCVRVKNWGGPWYNVETSPRLYVDPGKTVGWKWPRGRKNYRVYYC